MAQSDLLDSFGASPAGGEDYLRQSHSNLIINITTDLEFPEWPSAPKEPSFLFDSSLWTSIGSRQIRVRFAGTYDEGRFYGKVITCPSKHTGPQGQTDAGEVALEATNRKTRRKALMVDDKHIHPLPPTCKNVDCVPLNGDHRGQLLRVLKINKTAQTASVVAHSSTSNHGRWEEDLNNLCVVEDPRSHQ